MFVQWVLPRPMLAVPLNVRRDAEAFDRVCYPGSCPSKTLRIDWYFSMYHRFSLL
jgi:hypothetical protein